MHLASCATVGLPRPLTCRITHQLYTAHFTTAARVVQEPELRRVYVRITSAIKLDPVRPEYHRATLYCSMYATDAFSMAS